MFIDTGPFETAGGGLRVLLRVQPGASRDGIEGLTALPDGQIALSGLKLMRQLYLFTRYVDTDYAAKGQYAIDALSKYDIVCVHVEATDEASHEGDTAKKIKALEDIDQKVVAPIHQYLESQGEYRLLVTPDHPPPISTKTHSHGLVPFAMAGTGIEAEGAATYDEVTAGQSTHAFPEGWNLMKFFLGEF